MTCAPSVSLAPKSSTSVLLSPLFLLCFFLFFFEDLYKSVRPMLAMPQGTADARKSAFLAAKFWCILRGMNSSETPSAAASYPGHVKNGVVVLDDKVSLNDGQAVRVELVSPGTEARVDAERGERVRKLRQLFAEWTEEDSKLTDEEADRLRAALDRNRGLRLRSTKLD
jgi:hypothetical protein